MGTINCLITSILQNISFYVQHEKEMQIWNDERVSYILVELSL